MIPLFTAANEGNLTIIEEGVPDSKLIVDPVVYELTPSEISDCQP